MLSFHTLKKKKIIKHGDDVGGAQPKHLKQKHDKSYSNE